MGDSSPEMLASRANDGNFMFAFNDCDFSDRVLRLEIIPSDEDDDDSTIEPNKKLRGERYHEWFSCVQEPHGKELESACEGTKVKTLHVESCDSAKVNTLHLSSPILAAKSPFFYKLFKNGMKESQNKNDVSFKINAYEEATLMDLLRFMYGSPLSATSTSDLVDVLIAADKFEVTSCMRHCVQMLVKLPMSLESANFYLELPSSVLASEIVKPLIDASKQYLVARYRNFIKSHEEVMDLSLSALEVVLGSEGLQMISEDDVCDFTLKWARAHYPELEERREILTKCLARFMCFENISCSKLKEILACPDFNQEQMSKLVLEALFAKVELASGQRINASKELAITDYGFPTRVYSPRCVVYFDLKRQDLKNLSSFQQLTSQTFGLGGKKLSLMAQWMEEKDQFGLYVLAQDLEGCTLDFNFAVLHKSSREFQNKLKSGTITITDDKGRGTHNLLGVPWTEFVCSDYEYFINDVLHLRAELTLTTPRLEI